jgi:hypothetical protein
MTLLIEQRKRAVPIFYSKATSCARKHLIPAAREETYL